MFGVKPDLAIICLAGGQLFNWTGLYYLFPALLVKWETVSGWSRVDLTGALALFFLAGAALAPFLGSLLWRAGGYELVLPVLIALSVAGLALYLLAARANKKSLQ